MQYDLSILIPARNEMFLAKTIEDILSNIEANTEIIVGLDGLWANPQIKDDPRVTIVHVSEPLGQRMMTNQLCKLSRAKYVMKTDAHCAFDKGFDKKMLEAFKETGDNVTMIPMMKNLHAFDWVCPDGHRRYQSPSGPCKECGKETKKDIVWISKNNPISMTYRFDKTLHFQYWKQLAGRQEGDLIETMSIQGSCFMLTRDKYWELDICSEEFGSWGQQGVEVACKTWLSGGMVMVNRRTWYAHMFRTQGGDFGFPYPQDEKQVSHARNYSKELFQQNKWPKAIHTFDWLIDKFKPIPDWHGGTKGVVYYTDAELDPKIMQVCQEQLRKSIPDKKIVSVSLKPIHFGDKSIHLDLPRGPETMFKQILAGLEALDTDYAYLCESDVMYNPTHFDFTPPTNDKYYYNMNSWIIRASDGYAVYFDHKSLSGLCGDRQLLIKHFKARLKLISEVGFSRKMGFEPGTHNRPERVDDVKAEGFNSEFANLDIKHGKNLTAARWSPDQFRDKRNCQNWKVSNEILGWGKTNDIIKIWKNN